MLIVTHDIAAARLLAHRLLVMRHGRVVEQGLTDRVLDDPQHVYTQLLVASVLAGMKPDQEGGPMQTFNLPALRDIGRRLIGTEGLGKAFTLHLQAAPAFRCVRASSSAWRRANAWRWPALRASANPR